MGSIDWGDFLRGALALFFILAGVGLLFVCIKLGGLLGRLGRTVTSMTDEVVPILTRAQGTVDGINLELARVDEIMVTAVNATKGAEKTVTTLSHAAVAPVKKASGLAAAAREALSTFRARRQAGPDEADLRRTAAPEPGPASPPPAPEATEPPSPEATRERYVADAAAATPPAEAVAAREAYLTKAAEATPPAEAVARREQFVDEATELRETTAAAKPATAPSPRAPGRSLSSDVGPKAPDPIVRPSAPAPSTEDTGEIPAVTAGPHNRLPASMVEWALPKKKTDS